MVNLKNCALSSSSGCQNFRVPSVKIVPSVTNYQKTSRRGQTAALPMLAFDFFKHRKK